MNYVFALLDVESPPLNVWNQECSVCRIISFVWHQYLMCWDVDNRALTANQSKAITTIHVIGRHSTAYTSGECQVIYVIAKRCTIYIVLHKETVF